MGIVLKNSERDGVGDVCNWRAHDNHLKLTDYEGVEIKNSKIRTAEKEECPLMSMKQRAQKMNFRLLIRRFQEEEDEIHLS